MSDTPRTDKKINGDPCTRFAVLSGGSLRGASVPSEFARQLERELAAMTKERDFFRDAFNIQGDALSNVINQRDKEALAAVKGGQP